MTVTVEQENYPPRVKITTTGTAVWRTIGNERVEVRGGVIGGVAYDYELPQNVEAFYDDGTGSVGPVVMPDVGDWLIHLADPALSVKAIIRRGMAVSRPSRTALLEPVGAAPIAVSFARGAARGQLVLNTYTPEQEAAMLALLDDGSTVFLSSSGRHTIASGYLSLGDEDRDVVTRWSQPYRVFSLPYVVVARPKFVVSSTVAWSDLAPSWTALGSSWESIAEA